MSDAEKTEQKQLREEYLKAFRSSMKNTLKTVKIVDPEGNDVTPEKLKRKRPESSLKVIISLFLKRWEEYSHLFSYLHKF